MALKVFQEVSASEEVHEMVEARMKALRDDGWRLVHTGKTTIDEIVFATKDETELMRAAEGGGNVNGKASAAAMAVPVAV